MLNSYTVGSLNAGSNSIDIVSASAYTFNNPSPRQITQNVVYLLSVDAKAICI